jgi:outer membrane receptor protein involved in Fe transport
VVFSAIPSTELYLNAGAGFHSNDARGVVREPDPVTPLTRARGYEFGARTRLFDAVDLAGSVFLLDLDSELVWVGDEGTTEARGPTRRRGLEVEARWRILQWLFADADLTVSRATFVENAGNANAVALAPTLIAVGGVSARHPSGVYGRLGVVHLGDRAATEDGFLTAEGFTRVDATLGYRGSWFEVTLGLQNLLNTEWREAQFANVSRLPGETGPESCPAGTRAVGETEFEGCEDLHFTPGAPLNAQGSVSFFF